MFNRTISDGSKVRFAPVVLFSSFPGDWLTSGEAWTINADDSATMDNTTGANNFLSAALYLNQAVATPVTFRVKARGSGIAGYEYANDFGLYMIPTYSALGLAGEQGAVAQVPFPVGTWSDDQFEVTVTPTKPIVYLYCYLFARNRVGKLTVWDLELVPASGPLASYGEWKSDPIDLCAQENKTIAATGLRLEHGGFWYAHLDDVDDLDSVTHAVNQLKRLDWLVTREPADLNARGQQVISGLKAAGVKIFAYCSLGEATGFTLADVQTIVDRCAASGNYYGMFWDDAGWGPGGSDRTRQKAVTDYAHSKGLFVMPNSWNLVPEWLTATVDPVSNPTGIASPLIAGDWVLLESYYSRSDGKYGGYWEGSFSAVMRKYTDTKDAAAALGVKVAGLAYRMPGTTSKDTEDQRKSYTLGLLIGLDGWAFGSTSDIEYVTPDVRVGSAYVGALRQVSGRRWERDTNAGVIWFEADDVVVTRSAGAYATGYPLTAKRGIGKSSFVAGTIELTWETSADKVAWSEWTTGAVSRFVTVTAKMRA